MKGKLSLALYVYSKMFEGRKAGREKQKKMFICCFAEVASCCFAVANIPVTVLGRRSVALNAFSSLLFVHPLSWRHKTVASCSAATWWSFEPVHC